MLRERERGPGNFTRACRKGAKRVEMLDCSMQPRIPCMVIQPKSMVV